MLLLLFPPLSLLEDRVPGIVKDRVSTLLLVSGGRWWSSSLPFLLLFLVRRRSLTADDGGQRRGAAPRGEGTESFAFRRPPRTPPRALALAAALVEASGQKIALLL